VLAITFYDDLLELYTLEQGVYVSTVDQSDQAIQVFGIRCLDFQLNLLVASLFKQLGQDSYQLILGFFQFLDGIIGHPLWRV
jgi:hypothetical protein